MRAQPAAKPYVYPPVQAGRTVAEALTLLKQAGSVYVAVPHFGVGGDWSYVRVSREAAEIWLGSRLASTVMKPADPLYARMASGALHLGSVYTHDPEA